MAFPIARVDLSRNARDFRHVPVRPGVPVLDRPSANNQMLRSWLGRWIPEQNFDGESVLFYVRDEDGSLPEVTDCRPATAAELRGALQKEIQGIEAALRTANAPTAKDQELHRIVSARFQESLPRPGGEDPSSVFFRYRDAKGATRLIWCCGYQRVAADGGTTALCPEKTCRCLSLLKPDVEPKCPICGHALRQESRRSKRPIGALLLLLLLIAGIAGGLAAWRMRPELFGMKQVAVVEPPKEPAASADDDKKKDVPAKPREDAPAEKPSKPVGEVLAVIAGQVVDAGNGAPIAKAEVTVRCEAPAGEAAKPRTVETGDDGKFRIEGLPMGSAELEVTAARFASQKVAKQLAAAEESLRIELKPAAAVLAGVVVDGAGSPIAQAKVNVSGVPDGVETDAEGKFRLEGLAMGSADIEVAAKGFASRKLSKELTTSEETIRIELKPAAAALAGVVVDGAGSPIARAKVNVSAVPDGVETDAEGKFRLDGLAMGSTDIEVAAQGFASQKLSKELAAAEESVRIELKPAASALAGLVVNGVSGTPVADAKITVSGAPKAVETDSQGKFRFEGLSMGPTDIEVAAKGFASQTLSKDLAAAEESVRIELKPAAGVLAGVVVDGATGKPIAQATVKVSGAGDGVKTDAEGKFRLEGLGMGATEVEAAAAGYASGKVSKDIAAAEESIRIELKASGAALAGVVVNASSGEPIAGAKVTVVGVPGSVQTDAEGKFRVEGLAKGPAEIEVAAGGFDLKKVSKDIAAAEETVRVELGGDAVLTGQVIDEDSGSPVPGVWVFTKSRAKSTSGADGKAKTDDDGRFRIEKQAPGLTDINLNVPGYGYEVQKIAERLTAGQEKPILVVLRKKTLAPHKYKVRFFGIDAEAASVGYVVDCSGSMAGQRLERAKAELANSIIDLAPQQRFYVSFFSDAPVPITGEPRAPIQATPLEKVRAYKWLTSIGPMNGTVPEPALQLVGQMRPNTLFLLSDGEFPELQPDTYQMFKDHDTHVSTVAYEDPAGGATMEKIAQTTGGTHKFVPAGAPPPQHEVMIATRLFLLLRDALKNPPPSDRQAHVDALSELCDGQNFGPSAAAPPDEVKKSAGQWTRWWVDNRLVPVFQDMSEADLIKEFSSPVAVRRWGALEAAKRRRMFLPDQYITALDDSEDVVSQAARAALVGIADGEDYGPQPQANDQERAKARAQWKDWAETEKEIQGMAKAPSDVVRSKFRDPNKRVRRAAMRVAGRREMDAWDDYLKGFSDPDPDVRVAASQAITRWAKGEANFAPPPNATDAQWAQAAQEWKDWKKGKEDAAKAEEERRKMAAEQERIRQQQKEASGKFQAADQLYKAMANQRQLSGKLDMLKRRFQEIVDRYPGTDGAIQAQQYLDLPEFKYLDNKPKRSVTP